MCSSVCVSHTTTGMPTKLSNSLSSPTCRLVAAYKHTYTYIPYQHTPKYICIRLCVLSVVCGVDLFELIYNLAIWPVNTVSFFALLLVICIKSSSFSFSFYFYFYFYCIFFIAFSFLFVYLAAMAVGAYE